MGLEVIINNYWNQSSRGAVREGWVTGPAEQRLSSCHHDTLHWSLVMTRMSWWEALRSGAQVFATGNRSHRERHVHYCPLSRAVSAKPPATNTKLKDRQTTDTHTHCLLWKSKRVNKMRVHQAELYWKIHLSFFASTRCDHCPNDVPINWGWAAAHQAGGWSDLNSNLSCQSDQAEKS